MKINKQAKAQMHAAGDSVDTGTSQGARRATKDAPVSARPSSPSIDAEVVAVAVAIAIAKRRIVLAYTKPGEIGALMRREGVYTSALATWRHGDANMQQASSTQPILKNVVQKLPLTVMN